MHENPRRVMQIFIHKDTTKLAYSYETNGILSCSFGKWASLDCFLYAIKLTFKAIISHGYWFAEIIISFQLVGLPWGILNEKMALSSRLAYSTKYRVVNKSTWISNEILEILRLEKFCSSLAICTLSDMTWRTKQKILLCIRNAPLANDIPTVRRTPHVI